MRTRLPSAALVLAAALAVPLAAPLPALAAVPAGVAAAAPKAGHPFPTVVRLPNGFQPEGIATGPAPRFWVGSLAGGAIYRGSLRSGLGSVLVPARPGGVAVGMQWDRRTGYLFVAGGPTGTATVYDGESGARIRTYRLASGSSFVNDVVVTARAAWFTDSSNAVLYRVPLSPAGALAGPAVTVPLTGDWRQVPSAFNANGIVATGDGGPLVVVNTTVGALYAVDRRTGVATRVRLGGESVSAGDGLVLQQGVLYVVRGQLNEVVAVRLAADARSGSVFAGAGSSLFRWPSTAAGFGSHLYVVNARFDVAHPGPTTRYEVIRIAKP